MTGAAFRRITIAHVVVFGFALRALLFFLFPTVYYPDEIFQVLEPAHRLVHGQGYRSWEYFVGLRSWFFPGIVAGLLRFGSLFSSNPEIALLPMRGFVIAVSTIPIACAYLWGRNLVDRKAGLMLAACVAVSADLIFMAPHSFSEAMAANILVLALYFGYPEKAETRPSRLFLAGLLFGTAFILRIHLGPAIALAYAMICTRFWRRWLVMGAAALLVVLFAGGLDWLTYGRPFHSIFINVYMNINAGISSELGSKSPLYLFGMTLSQWSYASIVLLPLVYLGARRLPIAATVAAAIFLTHMGVGHKEWRFVFPAFPLLTILAGFGLVSIAAILSERTKSGEAGFYAPLLILFALVQISVATSPAYRQLWHYGREQFAAYDFASSKVRICGLGLIDFNWHDTLGTAYLPRGAGLYQSSVEGVDREAPAFNALIAGSQSRFKGVGFQRRACFDDHGRQRPPETSLVCVWTRPGTCQPERGLQPVNWPNFFRKADGSLDRQKIERFTVQRR